MKQMFSSYPDGIAGLALVMLRGSAAALLGTIFQSLRDPMLWLTVPIVLGAVAIMLGVATRPAALVCAVIAVPVLLTSKCASTLEVIGPVLNLLGLLLLGPGAVSIDARLFGRRKIRL